MKPIIVDIPSIKDPINAGRRTADASRPGLTEERAQRWAADLTDRLTIGPGTRALIGDALFAASRGEVPPASRDATEGLGPEPGILAPAASDPTAADHVSVPRAILERLAKAAASDASAREARWAAERILQQAALAAEPARTDPEAARAAALVAPHDRYLHDGPRETCPLPSCATPDPPSPADPLSALPAEERTRILDLAAEAHRKAFGFGDAASAAYYDTIRREVTAYHTRGPRCPDSGCEHPDHTRADEESDR